MSQTASNNYTERLALLQEIETNRYKYFIPNGAVEQYVRAVGEMMDKRIFVFAAANAVGKTSGVVNILANIFWPNYNQFFKYERYAGWMLPKKFWYASEHTTLKEAVVDEIEKWFPAGRYELQKSQGYPIHLETDTGFIIDFKRYDQDEKKYESATLGCVVLDEPPREKVFNACISRLRLGGIMLMPMTPLFGAAFVKDKLIDGDESGYVYVQYADVEENCKEHGTRGYLNHQDIEFMLSQYDDEEMDARAHGKFMFLSGLIFKEFNKGVHVISVDQIESIWAPYVYGQFERWPKVKLIDPHDRRSDFIIYATMTPTGDWIVYDEYPDVDFFKQRSRVHDIKQVLSICREKESGRTEKEWKALHRSGERLTISRRIMDRRKGAQNVSDKNLDLRDVYQNRSKEIGYPMTIKLSYDDKNKLDHKLIREALKYETSEGVYTRRPKLYIMRDCKNTIYGFEHYSWDDWSEKAAERRALSEKIKDKFKDPIDLVRYLLGEQYSYQQIDSVDENKDSYEMNVNTADGGSWLEV